MSFKEYRRLKNIPQEEIAEILQIDQSSYCKKEAKPDSFKPSQIKKLMSHYNLTIEEVYKMFIENV